MDAHDRAAAFTALEAALAISPSSALTYILGSVMLGWGGEAERAIEWSEQGMRLSPFDSWTWAAFDAQAMSHLLRGRYEELVVLPISPFKPTRHTASLMCNWPPRWPNSAGWTKRGQPPRACSSFSRPFATAASFLA